MRVVFCGCLVFLCLLASESFAERRDSSDWVVEKREEPAADKRLPPALPGEEVKQGMKIWTTTGSVSGGEAPEIISTQDPRVGDIGVIVDERTGKRGRSR